MGDFYGTGIEIWAGFGRVRQLLRPVFSCFHGEIFFLNIVYGEDIFEVYDGFIGQKILKL